MSHIQEDIFVTLLGYDLILESYHVASEMKFPGTL